MTVTATLTSTPIRVSTGAKAVHITVQRGSKPSYATGTSSPNKAEFHVLQEQVMNIGEGFSIWMWNDSAYPIVIAYSEAI